MVRVAVVGVGYSGVVVLEHLKCLMPGLNVDIYDDAGIAGAGQAYQRDILSNLVNRPAKLMYLRERGDFQNWLDKYGVRKAGAYQPRPLFGSFIEEALMLSLQQCPSIRYCRERVLDISHQHGGYALRTAKGEYDGYNAIVLATGNPVPSDVYQLQGREGYINSPYPTTKLACTQPGSIGGLGNQLSAIDAALALLEADFGNVVTLLSRNSQIPNYSGDYSQRKLKVLEESNISRRLSDTTSTLKTIREMFDEEFEEQGISVDFKMLMQDCRKVHNDREAIYSVFSSTNLIVPMMWGFLSEREKRIFAGRYKCAWRQLRVPIPKENWDKVHRYIRTGRLICHTGLTDVSSVSNGFLAKGKKFQCLFSSLINATGAGDSMDSLFYKKLAAAGMCIGHVHGGIQVRYDDCRVIGEQGPSNIFALGAPTAGVFYAVSNIDVLQKQAENIGRSIRELGV